MEIDLGVYTKERETKNTFRYERQTESGRPDTIYIQKSKFEGEAPDKIKITATAV